jgi:purine-nucleoside phosphorylase
MLITDHLNLTGRSPLMGANDDALGSRFPDLTHTWSARLNDLMRRAAAEESVTLAEGVYAGLTGPTYETPAEVTDAEHGAIVASPP